jgi:hypothetical protein
VCVQNSCADITIFKFPSRSRIRELSVNNRSHEVNTFIIFYCLSD